MTYADFADDISPFPVAGDQPYDHRFAVFPSMDTGIRSIQKLRPIRGSGRDLMGKFRDDGLLEKGGMAGTLMDCHGMAGAASTQVDFLSPEPLQKLRPSRRSLGERMECCYSPELPEKRCISENQWPPEEALTLLKMRPNMDNQFRNFNPKGLLSEILSSSSDDDHYDDSMEDVAEPGNRKRKRKTRKKLELFLEDLVEKVIKRQEEMHQQLIDMLERRENDRIMREEAWKQQTLERMKEDEELRTHEASRNLALISFIQNILGKEITIPQSIQTPCPEEDHDEKHEHTEYKIDPRNNRWPKSEVQALVTLRIAMEHKFRSMCPKTPIWEEISVAMSSMGYNRTPKKCKEKWENINKYFKRTMGSGKKHPRNANTCQYFQELGILYRSSGITSPGNASTDTISEGEDIMSAKEEMLNLTPIPESPFT